MNATLFDRRLNEYPLTDYESQLVESVTSDVHKCLKGDCRGWVNNFDSYDDAYQEAIVAVTKAARRYEESRGVIFWTFAWWFVVRTMRHEIPRWRRAHVQFIDNDERRIMAQQEPERDTIPKCTLRKFCRLLARRERRILWWRSQGEKLETCGERLGVTKQRVSQIEKRAKAKVRDIASVA